MDWLAPTPMSAQLQQYAPCTCVAPENPVLASNVKKQAVRAMEEINRANANLLQSQSHPVNPHYNASGDNTRTQG